MTPKLSVVVLSWNTVELTLACLRALRADTVAAPREVILVDNFSEDGTADRVAAEFPEVRLIRNPANLLYSEGNNVGARAATGEYLCLLNSDTEVHPGALDTLVTWLAAHPEYAIVGPKFVHPDGRLQSGCRRLPGLAEHFAEWSWLRGTRWARQLAARGCMADFDHLASRDIEQPLGACVVVRREEYLTMGGLDPVLSLFFNDVDFCLRLRQRGRKVRYLVDAVVMHHQGASTKKKDEEFGNPLWHRNRLSFYRKHHGLFGTLAGWSMLMLSLTGMLVRIVLGRRPLAEKRAALRRLRSFAARSFARART
jgi:N-acetylglucosaminyl-diphospho-decaprenol L-rhamnosyltransferase